MMPALAMATLAVLCFPQDKQASEAEKILKKKTSLLRASKKDFATFRGADPAKGVVTLKLESGGEARAFRMAPDAEVRIRGSWGRLEDLAKDDRVWIWRTLDRKKKPADITLVSDEISEQAIHAVPYTVKSAAADRVVVHRALGRNKNRKEATRTLAPTEGVEVGGIKEGDPVYIQTAGDRLRQLLTEEGLKEARRAQEEKLRARWREKGLPGTVAYIHGISGEAEVMLDHETIRWARGVKAGSVARLMLETPVKVVVQDVRPYREKTRMTLVAAGQEFHGLKPGERVFIGIDPVSDAPMNAALPPDLGRFKEREARIGWVLSSTYCGCSVGGDG